MQPLSQFQGRNTVSELFDWHSHSLGERDVQITGPLLFLWFVTEVEHSSSGDRSAAVTGEH